MEGLVLNCVSEVGSVWAATDLLYSLNQGNEMGSLELSLTRQQSGAHRTCLKEQKVPLGKEWSLVLGRTTPQAKRSSNEHRKKKIQPLKSTETLQRGPLRCTSCSQVARSNPCNRISFSKWQNQKVANCDLFPGSYTNKTSCKHFL